MCCEVTWGFVDLMRDDSQLIMTHTSSCGICSIWDWVWLPGVVPLASGGIRVSHMPALGAVPNLGNARCRIEGVQAPQTAAVERCCVVREQELQEADDARAGSGRRRRLPAGTSEYQAAWILDDDDGDDLESDDEPLPGGGGGSTEGGVSMEGADADGEPGGTDEGGTDDWQDDEDDGDEADRMEVPRSPPSVSAAVRLRSPTPG